MTEAVTSPPHRALEMRSLWRRIVDARGIYLALVPTFGLVALFQYYPAFSALYHAFFRWNGGNLKQFVGLGHFEALLRDQAFLVSMRNVTYWVIFRIVAQISMPLVAAELVYNLGNDRSRYWWQVLFVVPMVVPGVLMMLIWKFIYDPSAGIINTLLRGVGLVGWAQPWLGDYRWALKAIAFMGSPWVSSLQFLVLLGGLQAIPASVIDASRVDGATTLQRVFLIDIPSVMGQIRLLAVLLAINLLQTFETFLVLTGGGPGYATMVPGLHLYTSAFTYQKFGYASAIGLVLFIILLGFTALALRARQET